MTKKQTAVIPPQGQALTAVQAAGETEAQTLARTVLSPMTSAAITAFNFRPVKGMADVGDFVVAIRQQVKKVTDGDLSGPEAILVSQAHALDMIFCTLAQKASQNMGEHLNATETYLRMALKAQAQCRSTIEALGELKTPRTTTFNKQVNIAEQQQVNNGTDNRSSTPASARPHEKNITPTNELLTEGQQNAAMDTRAAGETVGANSELETVGAVNRPH